MAVVVKQAGDLVAAAAAAQEKGATGVFLYLFGDLEEDSGESWCGDCADGAFLHSESSERASRVSC